MFATLCLVIVGLFLSAAPVSGQVEFLEQNWPADVRQEFYTTSQGSRIMPYSWFIALEISDSQKSFYRDRLPELGYLPNSLSTNNPDKLPVGFVRDQNEITKADYIGMNCAACHTNQISLSGKTFQIDGAPSLSDMGGMLTGLDDSLKATRDNADKFDRFAAKVLGAQANNSTAKNELKSELTNFLKYWSKFVQDSTVEHPWGRARMDAFGMIFNRVASIDLGIPENSKKPDAPVSVPFLWGTSFQSQVQWNGVAPNTNDIERLGRNVGEVLGVFAEAQFQATRIFEIPKPARTSAKRLNQVRLENLLKKLWSPKWPEDLVAIDAAKKEAGKALYQTHCAECHAIVPHGEQNTPVDVVMTKLSEVRTDPKMAVNATIGVASTGDLKWLFEGRSKVPRGELLQTLVQLAVLSPYRDVAPSESILDRLTRDDLFGPNEIKLFLREIGFSQQTVQALHADLDEKLKSYYDDLQSSVKSFNGQPESATVAENAPPTLKYKAAPLAGIWATAPYLHNGSVPNLYELLLPSDERTSKFYVGSREFDAKKVGFKTEQAPGTTLFDTSLPGNSNAGHDTYGTFNEEQRWQLVEYLKSL
jgi:mono/diheme cytochrome c family protein